MTARAERQSTRARARQRERGAFICSVVPSWRAWLPRRRAHARDSVLFPALSPFEKVFDQSSGTGGEAGANDDRDHDLEELLVAWQGDAQVARLADVIMNECLRRHALALDMG